MTLPQDLHGSEPTFAPYPTGTEGTARTVLFVTHHTGDSQRPTEPSRSEPMSESYALAAMERLCAGESLPEVQVRDNDEVIQISEREVVIRSTATFFGRHRFTRVQIGRLRHTARKGGQDTDLR